MDHTKHFFDNHASSWDSINRYEKSESDFYTLLSYLDLKDGYKVADIGCGTGVLIPYIQEKIGTAGTIFAVDISEKMIEELKKKFSQKNIRTFAMPAEELSKIEDTVDAVICFSMFPHVTNKQRLVEETSKALKVGGKFLIAHFSSRDEINDFHSKLPEPICHHVLPDLNEMKKMLASAKMELVDYFDGPSEYRLLARKTAA